jgi:ATP-binding protein involved in chromosome partitioning
MIDPRDAGIALQLAGVRLVLAVSSGKGGVGKSTCAVVGSLLLARRGLAVGLLDLDFQGASCHTLLGCRPGFPSEDRGLLPLEPVTGLRFATIASFVGERPAAMRGSALADALREMLAVTRWGALDVLVVDMPPGIHDTTLELARIAPKARHLVISTGSVVALTVASRLLRHLGEAGTAVAGLVENMAPSGIGVPGASAVRFCPRGGHRRAGPARGNRLRARPRADHRRRRGLRRPGGLSGALLTLARSKSTHWFGTP